MVSQTSAYTAAIALCLGLLGAFGCSNQTLDAHPDHWVGVGVELRMEPAGARVVRVISGGPAASAGLATDQVIVEVDGNALRGQTLSHVVNLLRGKPQTTVQLVAKTKNGEKPFTLLRKAIVASR